MRRDFATRSISLALCLLLVIGTVLPRLAALPDDVIPPVWDIVTEDFERGTLDGWTRVSPHDLRLVRGRGHNRPTGLSVTVSQHDSLLRQTRIGRAKEGYLSFWIDPNGTSIPDQGTTWLPGKSIQLAMVTGPSYWRDLVGLWLHRPTGGGYKVYLGWQGEDGYHYDYQAGDIDLVDGWHRITLGYRVDEWVALWLDGVKVREITGITHDEAWGEIIEIGKTNTNSSITPSGALNYDDVTFQVRRVDSLWVDAIGGDDGHDGLTASTAFRTIQRAADLAGPGTAVHILPGIYRETVWPAMNGSAAEASHYIAENGPGTAVIRGSEPSSSLAWTQLTANTIGLQPGVDPTKIYYADLTAWQLDGPPRFIVELSSGGNVAARLPLAREPDWGVTAEWKHAEFWWAADGGSSPAACDPATNSNHNCDLPQRSTTQLTDHTNDAEPAGIEAGNLTTLGDLTGATLVAQDTVSGHYVYRRAITAHDVANGRITVDEACEFDSGSGNPGLGWGSKYYVEGKPQLLDNPGEWWYDATTKRLYLWPPTPGNPATLNIEISRRDNGFSLHDRSYVTLDGLTIEFVNESAVHHRNWITDKSYHNTVRNAVLRYANWGVFINQEWRIGADPNSFTDGFTLENSTIAYIDSSAIRLLDQWDNGSAADSFTRSGIMNIVIRNNEMHHLAFRHDADDADGLVFTAANQLRFESNSVHDVARNAVLFDSTVIQSPKTYGFAPSEIKTGNILILNNTIERACELATDCGAVKFWGYPPDNHVYRDVLITGNVFRDTFGWTHISEERQLGASGYGLFLDHASGIHAYRNIAYNDAFAGYYFYGTWRDGDIVYYNNIAANSLFGMNLDAPYDDTHGSVNTQLVNNTIVNNEYYGIRISSANGNYPNTTINHNLYFNNGWNSSPPSWIWKPGDMMAAGISSSKWYQTLSQIQANTAWEAQGMEGDPGFWSYNPADHDLHDGSWPDFHVTANSVNVVDRGTANLPTSLTRLLTEFGVFDPHFGSAFDIGRYEAAGVIASPATRAIQPGATTGFVLSSYPPSFPAALALTASCPDPHLLCSLSSGVLGPGQTVTLTVVDTHDPGTPIGWPAWYTIPVAAAYGGSTQNGYARLLVGGKCVYLPSVF